MNVQFFSKQRMSRAEHHIHFKRSEYFYDTFFVPDSPQTADMSNWKFCNTELKIEKQVGDLVEEREAEDRQSLWLRE